MNSPLIQSHFSAILLLLIINFFSFMKKLLKSLTIITITVGTLLSLQVSSAAASEKPNFQWPAEGEITAKFNDKNYALKKYFKHSGIDIDLEQGTEVKAAAKGKVIIAKPAKDESYAYVMITHKKGYATLYGHLSRVDVKKNQKVERGEVIGLSGGEPGTNGSGNSTGSHLHFEVRNAGTPVNPLKNLPDTN